MRISSDLCRGVGGWLLQGGSVIFERVKERDKTKNRFSAFTPSDVLRDQYYYYYV